MQYWNGFARFQDNLVQNFNIKQPNVDEDDPWIGILSATEFVNILTTNRLKGYNLGNLLFGRDMILRIKHKVYWDLFARKIRQRLLKIISSKKV